MDSTELIDQFRQELAHCQQLFDDAARQCIESHPRQVRDATTFCARLRELHRGLLTKIVVEVAQSDWHWSENEYLLARALFEHCWKRRLSRAQLKEALKEVGERSGQLSWDSLLRPFAEFPVLRKLVGDVETIVLRVANMVAKIDGQVSAEESQRLKGIQAELQRCLKPMPLEREECGLPEGPIQIRQEKTSGDSTTASRTDRIAAESLDPAQRKQQLDTALHELQGLTGLDCIKRDVSELTNFLKMQAERAKRGLPQTKVSLHMIFGGNPGTGKTTVARLLGRILGGLGILSRGHLIETDRSGLVANYAGQTSSKTHKQIDQALDGVLFIDEAYSLVAEQGDDPYGTEAVQALLKRMEDDRDRLVVILAGYPDPMDRLLATNPGLASRFGRRLDFPDYSASELGRIFQAMCDANGYSLPAATRARLLAGFQHLRSRRDEKFGNGRLARNVFETAIRRLANRIADIAPLTADLLATIEPADVVMPDVPEKILADVDDRNSRVSIICPGCGQTVHCQSSLLGRHVQCKRCGHGFQLDWAELDG